MSDGKKHALHSPSSADRWARCAASMAFPENRTEGASSIYADEGTAAHTVASRCLQEEREAFTFIGETLVVGANSFTVDEEFAAHVQTYLDDVLRRSMGGQLFVEQRVSLEHVLGEEEGGTSDAIVITAPDNDVDAEVVDLKFGQGETVYSYNFAEDGAPFTFEIYLADEAESTKVEPNYQLMLYAIGALEIIRMFLEKCKRIRLVINQPRTGNLSELIVTTQVLDRFSVFIADAKKRAEEAAKFEPTDPRLKAYFNPGEKQCRWCRAPHCEARDGLVEKEVGDEFEVIEASGARIPASPEALSRAFRVIPFIKDWIKKTEARANEIVAGGGTIIGSDKKPMKFVEGQLGDRTYVNEKDAETALLGQLPEDQVYQPRKIISAATVNKKFNKKKTEQLWKDVFAPLIHRPPGKPQLVLGSDPRPPYVGAASSEEFDKGEAPE